MLECYPIFILMISLESCVLFVRREITTWFKCLRGNIELDEKIYGFVPALLKEHSPLDSLPHSKKIIV